MSVFLKGCNSEHTELSIHFKSVNDECAIVKEAKDANLLSQEPKLLRVNWQLNLCPSKLTTPVLKRILFNKFTTMNFLGHTTSWSDYDMK